MTGKDDKGDRVKEETACKTPDGWATSQRLSWLRRASTMGSDINAAWLNTPHVPVRRYRASLDPLSMGFWPWQTKRFASVTRSHHRPKVAECEPFANLHRVRRAQDDF